MYPWALGMFGSAFGETLEESAMHYEVGRHAQHEQAVASSSEDRDFEPRVLQCFVNRGRVARRDDALGAALAARRVPAAAQAASRPRLGSDRPRKDRARARRSRSWMRAYANRRGAQSAGPSRGRHRTRGRRSAAGQAPAGSGFFALIATNCWSSSEIPFQPVGLVPGDEAAIVPPCRTPLNSAVSMAAKGRGR